MNWYAGWWLILAGFASGAALGLFFHRPDFLGGYGSFRRRMLRLGHIACAALGMLNLIVSLSLQSSPLLVAGGAMMPAICFLTAWKEKYRHLFFLPVLALLAAVVFVLCGSGPAESGPGRPNVQSQAAQSRNVLKGELENGRAK
jgi:hypothetical protein